MTKNWTLAKRLSEKVSKNLEDYPILVQQLLFNRELKTKEEAETYLNPSYERDLHDPFLMADMKKAAERVIKAIQEGEKTIIYGDYDADGIPGTAIIATFFKAVGYTNFDIYIPDRSQEDYGLNFKALNEFIANKVNLIITVDCGITDVPEVKAAQEAGIDVIITDHHLALDTLPPAYAIVDAKRLDDTYPYKMLCGAAVAFKLVLAMLALNRFGLKEGWEKWLLDLVVISTVTDMVPMREENRALTHFGLKVLRQTKRLGLLALFSVLKIKPSQVTEDDIGFMVGPRLNAASRMSKASQAYYLLMTEDLAEAETIARHLEEKNKDRRDYVDVILKEVDEIYKGKEIPAVIVAGNHNWTPGVLGLTCSRLVEKYQRPVFLWTKGDGESTKGSARSDGTVSLVELMKAVGEDFFINMGGHHMAAGFSFVKGKEEEFAQKVNEVYVKLKNELVPELRVDAKVSLDDLNWELYEWIEKMGPYGIDNPKPVFWFENIEIDSARAFGNGGIHLELSFRNSSGKKINAIGFFSVSPAEKFDGINGHSFHGAELERGKKVNLLANLEKSTFFGPAELRLRIVDIQKGE